MFRNDGGGVFVPAVTNLSGTYEGTVAWGDYDNDGRLDLLVSGNSYSPSRIYRNLGRGSFINVDAGLRTMSGYIDSWADLDNDGDLDLIQAGNTNFTIYTYRSFVYRNN